MTIQLDPEPANAQREADAIAVFMRVVGRAQADVLGETLSFAFSEGDSVSRENGNLSLDVDAARRGRGRHGLSWVYVRLVELVEIETQRSGHRQDDRHAGRIARQAGGVMGTRIVRWQEDTASRRRHLAEVRRERLRFLEQRVRFAEAVRRAQRQERSAR